MYKNGGMGFRSSIVLILIIVVILYIILNNFYLIDQSYSINLGKGSCSKGKLTSNQTNVKNCQINCVAQFEEKTKTEISCQNNSTTTATCRCSRTIYNNYIKKLF
jgi:hypothetical protein